MYNAAIAIARDSAIHFKLFMRNRSAIEIAVIAT